MDTINVQELLTLSPGYLLVVDLEATCCDAGTIAKHESEIIEIGAIIVDLISRKEVSRFNEFVKPVRHPKLTPFCTQLTSIVQAEVDNAKPLADVMNSLKQWLHPFSGSYVMCSWGNYDRNHIISDCEYFDVDNPIDSSHLNLKAAFAKKQKIKRCGLQKALGFVGLGFKGQHHRGIDDAHNVVRLLDYCI